MAEPISLPSLEVLNSFFEEREPGVLYWKVGRGNTRAGSIAGFVNVRGYHCIHLNRRTFQRHRVIWKMHGGGDPVGIIDHINGKPGDDRIENLRDVTHTENSRNGRYFVSIDIQNRERGIYQLLRLSFLLWPDEDETDLRDQLERLVSPFLENIIAKRVGRIRPSENN